MRVFVVACESPNENGVKSGCVAFLRPYRPLRAACAAPHVRSCVRGFIAPGRSRGGEGRNDRYATGLTKDNSNVSQ
jgi:hypothetical protein